MKRFEKTHFYSTLLGVFLLVMIWALSACEKKKAVSSIDPVNWESKTVKKTLPDSLKTGSTYLSVYSQIYSQTEHATHNLTATVSMRNISRTDTVYIDKAQYFNTKGELIRTYFDKAIFILPMETVEIVIDEKDQEGGTGANFVFDWRIKKHSLEPYFEGIMTSTSGQQGLSLTTQGRPMQ